MDTAEIKQKAMEFGADLVGIGDINRFEGTPKINDPRYIAPSAKSIICLGFRILRGCFRGIESGTNFYQLPTMGIAHIDTRHAPMTLRRLACFLEDNGYEGVVHTPEKDRCHADNFSPDPEMMKTVPLYSIPVSENKPPPDVIVNPIQGAYLCGIGEIGVGGFLLTPEFGPLQRVAFIFTDAELEADPIREQRNICDECGKCVAACPGKAISFTEKETHLWGGNEISFHVLNPWQCYAYQGGAHLKINPFAPPDILSDMKDADKIVKGEKQLTREEAVEIKRRLSKTYPDIGFNYVAVLCGKACIRECMVHLEQRKILKKQFINPFRSETPWYKIER